MRPRSDPRLGRALVRRGHQSDRGIPNTLPVNTDPAYSPDYRFNSALTAKCETTCHCEKRVMPTTWQRIFDGLGETCGAPNCKPKENP